MAEDGDWPMAMDIMERLILVAIYGAKDLGRSEEKSPQEFTSLMCIKGWTGKEHPDWDLWEGENLPILEEVAMPCLEE